MRGIGRLGVLIAAVAIALTAIGVHVGLLAVIWGDPTVMPLKAWATSSYAILWIPFALLGLVVALMGRVSGSAVLGVAFAATSLNEGLHTLAQLGVSAPGLAVLDLAGLAGMIGAGAYLRATQLFPRRLRPAHIHSTRSPWRRLPVLRELIAVGLWPWAAWIVAGAWLFFSSRPETDALASLAVIALGLIYWHVQLRIGSVTTRRKLVWFVQAAAAMLLLSVLATALSRLIEAADAAHLRPWLVIGYNAASALAGCGFFAAGVFAAGAVNPTLIVKATVIYGAAATALLFMLNVIIDVVADAATASMQIPGNLAAAVLGSAAGLLIDPLVRRLRKLVARFSGPVKASGRSSAQVLKPPAQHLQDAREVPAAVTQAIE